MTESVCHQTGYQESKWSKIGRLTSLGEFTAHPGSHIVGQREGERRRGEDKAGEGIKGEGKG